MQHLLCATAICDKWQFSIVLWQFISKELVLILHMLLINEFDEAS